MLPTLYQYGVANPIRCNINAAIVRIIPAITIAEDSPKKSILVRDISTCPYLNIIASLDNKGSISIARGSVEILLAQLLY